MPLLLFSMGTMAWVIREVEVGVVVWSALKMDAKDGYGCRSAVSWKYSSAACVNGEISSESGMSRVCRVQERKKYMSSERARSKVLPGLRMRRWVLNMQPAGEGDPAPTTYWVLRRSRDSSLRPSRSICLGYLHKSTSLTQL